MSKRSYAGRAVAAVLLTIGFYLLAIGIAAALLFVCYAMIRYSNRISIKLFIVCIVGAFAILFAICPRYDRFVAPGLRLVPEKHPLLFRRIREVANSAGQKMPREIYLVPDLNAWVADRGGFMGIGSRRIMGLGLPLLSIMSIKEFDGVLAHEFGHYHGGDTSLGPWIFKTRIALGRTLANLGNSWLQAPFRGYANMFMRITQSISRAQEFAADHLAAGIAGAGALASGLVKIHTQAPLYDHFLQNEFQPVIESGFVAPMIAGFAAFRQTPKFAQAAREIREENLQAGPADKYDSHPSLRERLESLGIEDTPATEVEEASTTALKLLEDAQGTEKELLDFLLSGSEGAPGTQAIGWDDAIEKVYLPHWNETARQTMKILDPVRLDQLAMQIDDKASALIAAFIGNPDQRIAREHWPEILTLPIGSVLVVALTENGWTLESGVGLPITAVAGSRRIEPFALVARMLEGADGRKEWNKALEANECGDLMFTIQEELP